MPIWPREGIYQNWNSLSLLLHYPIQKKPSADEYYFLTTKGFIYEVYFTDSSGYFPKETTNNSTVQIFGFYTYSKTKSFDPLVSNTIVKIISDYFEENPLAVLLFAYDQSEGKQVSRKRLFKRWYQAYAMSNFEKVELTIDGVDYASAIFLHNHPQSTEIISLLKALVENVDGK